MEQMAVKPEVVPEHIGDRKDNMAMLTIDKLGGDGIRPVRLVSSPAGRTKA